MTNLDFKLLYCASSVFFDKGNMRPTGPVIFACGVAAFLILRPSYSGSIAQNPDWKNADLVLFNNSVRFHDEEFDTTAEGRDAMQSWYLALRKAAMLLPAGFVKEIAFDLYDDNPICQWDFFESRPNCLRKWIRFSFFIESTSWVTAYPNAINLKASSADLPYWLIWEPFPKDGYTEEERVWIALHEFAHRYNKDTALSSDEKLYLKLVDAFRIESPTTFYGCVSGEEDFADTFALYVMFPEQLKRFPLRYEAIKILLGREYNPVFQIPNSVKSKLADPAIGCEQYINYLASLETATEKLRSLSVR